MRFGSLKQGLDRHVYQIVRKLESDDDDTKAANFAAVYESIMRSNSSLKRHKKRQLEDAIERVLAVRREESKDETKSQDSDGAVEERERAAALPVTDTGFLNRQMTKSWPASSSGAADEMGKGPFTSDEGAVDGFPAAQRPKATADRCNRLPNGEPRAKKKKATAAAGDQSLPDISLANVAGMAKAIEQIAYRVLPPLCMGSMYQQLGYRPELGVLLHGPSGCGKTMLGHAVANHAGKAFIPVMAASLVGGTSGESEKNIRDIFDEAIALAPALIFIDEIDAIAGKRDSAQKSMEGRMLSELANGMDRVKAKVPLGKHVVVMAATSRPDSLDSAVRRRFNIEIEMGMPNELAREQILKTMTRQLPLAADVDCGALARLTPGYVGSDLRDVVDAAVAQNVRATVKLLFDKALEDKPRTTAQDSGSQGEEIMHQVLASKQLFQQFDPDRSHDEPVSLANFKAAIREVQPASKREGFSTIPNTTWADVGALGDVRRKLEMSIIGPIREPDMFARLGIRSNAGILLYGPPGCGKTLVAKAVANESQANFISIKGPELLNKYVGESERAVRQLFARARSSAPCVLFFDEMDALVPARGNDSSGDASARVVNALLTELDGVEDRAGVYVVGATNRPELIDEALRRPGRLGTSIYVGLPSVDERVDILKTLYRNSISSPSGVDLEAVARDVRCSSFSGADLGNLLQTAAQACLERTCLSQRLMPSSPDSMVLACGSGTALSVIEKQDWETALNRVKPSVRHIEVYLPD